MNDAATTDQFEPCRACRATGEWSDGHRCPSCGGAGEVRIAAFERENRIRANRRLLETLADLWDAVPDQRFGQLVMNLSRTEGGFADTWEWKHGDWRERIEEAWTTWAKP